MDTLIILTVYICQNLSKYTLISRCSLLYVNYKREKVNLTLIPSDFVKERSALI